ncbi:MAG: chemotaxis protein CheB [Solirubrobacteraceae bacterium]
MEQPDGVSAETSGDDDLEPDARRRPPRCSCKPAVDVTLRSAQKVWGSRTLTVILTGMGSDGLAGARSLRGVGGRVLAQDAATSVVWGMPGAVAREGLPELLPLDDVAPVILTAVEGTALATIAITNMTGMGAR